MRKKLNTKEEVTFYQPTTGFIQSKLFIKDDIVLFPSLLGYNRSKKFQLIKCQPPQKQANTINPRDIESELQREKKIRAELETSVVQIFYDQPPTPLFGKEATGNFYRHYKKIDKIEEQNKFHKIADSVQTRMIKRTESLNLLPCKLGVIRDSPNEHSRINLTNSRVLGDVFIEKPNLVKDQDTPLNTPRQRPQVLTRDIDISKNRVCSPDLSSFVRQGKFLHMAGNPISKSTYTELIKVIQMQQSMVECLNLEDTNLGNRGANNLCIALFNLSSLRTLNIAKNNISCAIALSRLVKKSDSMQELVVHWNRLQGVGGRLLFEALQQNNTLLVLDVSYNGLGCGQKCYEKIVAFITNNKTLLHLDLTLNQFKKDDSKCISDALNLNHTIYGLHFAGNYGYIDSSGFLCIDDYNQDQCSDIHITQRIKSLQYNQFNKKYSQTVATKDVCWICEGWHQQTFVLNQKANDPVFIHLSYRNYEGIIMNKKNDQFTYITMAPPQDIQFFFTVNDLQETSNNYEVIETIDSTFRNVIIRNRSVTLSLQYINKSHSNSKFTILQTDGTPLIDILPRTKDRKPIKENTDTVWSFEISIWAKEYRPESEEFLLSCFEWDWEQCTSVLKGRSEEEIQKLKLLIMKHYRALKQTHKQFSSIYPLNGVQCMCLEAFQEFIVSTTLVDGVNLKVSDAVRKYIDRIIKDMKFIATCSSFQQNNRKSERALDCCQFIELLIRLAEEKFLKTKISSHIYEAMRLLYTQCSDALIYDEEKWRKEKYFTAECDQTLKHYRPFLDHIYNENCTKKANQERYMTLQQFKSVVESLFDSHFSLRDMNLAFNLSQSNHVKDGPLQMSLNEYYEAIVRIASVLSPTFHSKNQEIPYDLRFNQPLHIKIESTIVRLMQIHNSPYFPAPNMGITFNI